MKKLIIFFLAFQSYCFGQTPCTQPLDAKEFNKQFDVLNRIQNDKDRLVVAKALLQSHCLNSNQAKLICMIFNNENPRLNFAIRAYNNITDKDEFYEVLDAFKLYSSVFKLYDVMHGHTPQINEPANEPTGSITYPIFDGYKGPKGCTFPISENDFKVLTLNFANQANEAVRMKEINEFAGKNCISMSQLMKLSLMLQLESSRLQFLKKNFERMYDQANYTYASAVFNTGLYKADWENFAAAYLAPPVPLQPTQPVVIPCTVSTEDFASLKKSILNETGNTVRMALTKQIIAAKKCFTSAQVKDIVGLMFYESGKIEMAKYAFDYTIDKSNYYQVAEALNFASSKTELMEFLKGK